MKRGGWLLLAALLSSGCGSFRQPPLPVAAQANAAPAPTAGEEASRARLLRADTIYFSLTKSSAAAEMPIWRVVQMLQESGARVTVGWAEVPAAQQPLFDQWERQEISAAQLPERLLGPERAPFLHEALRPGLRQIALGCPRELLAKIRDGGALTADEEAQLPRDFRPAPDALENFLDRIATSPRWRRYNVRHLFRAHLVAEQTIALHIAQFCRAEPKGKLIVFLPNDALIDPREIAAFAAQQFPLQQLILDRAAQPLQSAQPRLVLVPHGGNGS